MPHTTKSVKKTTCKKVMKKKSTKKKLWNFWYYNFADYEWNEEVFYEGPFEDLRCDGSDYYDFLNHMLFPGIDSNYISMQDKNGNKLTQIPTNLKQKVFVYFKPGNLIEKMHRYLPKDILEDHYLALEECGWTVVRDNRCVIDRN